VRYSAPLVLHALGFWAINAQDRYFVAAMVGVGATGIYTVAYGLGSALNLIHLGVLRAFNPHFYEHARSGYRERVAIVRFTYAYVVGSIVVLALFLGFVWLVVPVFLGPAFASSVVLIPWVALGYTFNAVRNLMTGYLYIAERTRLLGGLTLSAAVLNALLNFLFIGFWGALGAAIATAFTFAYVAAVTTVFAVRSHAMPWGSALRRKA
jgi:O-antigen/teichoic acid export membrane protein